eukprot:1343958-Alexandrium_andersonii.AAC.1
MVRADWAEYAHTLGMPSWAHTHTPMFRMRLLRRPPGKHPMSGRYQPTEPTVGAEGRQRLRPVSYTHLRAHETSAHL